LQGSKPVKIINKINKINKIIKTDQQSRDLHQQGQGTSQASCLGRQKTECSADGPSQTFGEQFSANARARGGRAGAAATQEDSDRAFSSLFYP